MTTMLERAAKAACEARGVTPDAVTRQWRSLWRVRIPHGAWAAGDEYWDGDAYPTHEIAEEKAREEMAWDAVHGDALIEDWVGAFPDPMSQGDQTP